MVLGVEITGNRDQRGPIRVKQLLQQESELEGLAGATHGGEEIALCPATDRLPDEGLELLARDCGRKRRTQMDVDDGDRVAIGRLDSRDKYRAVEAYRLSLCLRRNGRLRQVRQGRDADGAAPRGAREWESGTA